MISHDLEILDYSFVQKGLAAGQLDDVNIWGRTEGDTVVESARGRLREELTAAFRGLETLLDELFGADRHCKRSSKQLFLLMRNVLK
jgi:hypothetical protein